VIIAQTGSLLKYLGQLELVYTGSGTLRLRNGQNNQPFLLPLDYHLRPDPEAEALLEGFTNELNTLIKLQTGGRFSHVLDTVALTSFPVPGKPLQETPFGNFVTDAMRIITSQKTEKKVDIAVQANGSIRGGITPGTLAHSREKITFYDLAELVGLGMGPDGNAGYPIVSFYLTGEEVHRVLEVAVLLQEMFGGFLQFSGLRYDYDPRNAVLFNAPVINQPVPSSVLPGPFRAVTRVELYTGNDPQGMGSEGFVPISRGDQKLYHLVTDSYILSFLPMVGKILPMLNLELKDANGNVISRDRLDELIVRVGGQELKVWQTVVEYASIQPPNAGGIPVIDPYYSNTVRRINPVRSFPLVLLPLLVLIFLLLLTFTFRGIVRRRCHRFHQPYAPAGERPENMSM
jgi:5'-nucleotidase / UDP-sugar diphosphatase